MPLDPFFAERLRVHRRYMFDQVITGARVRAASLWPFRRPGAGENVTRSLTPSSGAAGDGLAPHARARAKHRRAALGWDRTQLREHGIAGPDVRTSEHRIEVDGVVPFRVRVYHPAEADRGPVPAVLSFFGGAFRIGGIDYPSTDAAHRRRAADAGVAVVAVDYALAPEHRYPVQIEQGYAALRWLFAQADSLGVDPERIGVAGTSAGANIAAVVTLLQRDRGGPALRLQVLEVPVVDLTGRHLDLGATRALGIPSVLALRELRSIARTYLAEERHARDAYASPLRAETHAGLPPAVILTAEYDPLRRDGDAYAGALRDAGVDASVVRYQGGTHDTALFGRSLASARRWHDDVVSALRRLHD